MIEIIEVKTGKQRKEFVSYVNELYRDEPNFMPAVFSDSLASITPGKNKAFNFCEARFWLAEQTKNGTRTRCVSGMLIL